LRGAEALQLYCEVRGDAAFTQERCAGCALPCARCISCCSAFSSDCLSAPAHDRWGRTV